MRFDFIHVCVCVLCCVVLCCVCVCVRARARVCPWWCRLGSDLSSYPIPEGFERKEASMGKGKREAVAWTQSYGEALISKPAWMKHACGTRPERWRQDL